MSQLRALARQVLLGTERNPVELPSAGGQLGALIDQLDPAAAPEAAVLRLSGILSCHETAGRRSDPAAVLAEPLPAPCDAEDRPECGSRAAALLRQAVEDKQTRVVAEWLALAVQRGVRVPFDLLTTLLTLASREKGMRDSLPAAIGRRGLWLAAMNEEWRAAVTSAAAVDDPSVWEDGRLPERVAYLRGLRLRDPRRARELAAASIRKEPARERAEFTACFETGLSLDDEAFLETLLDDRGKEVRRVAADLLSRLPESALCRRMKERIASLMVIQKKLLKTVLVLDPPEKPDAAVLRDIGEEPVVTGEMGERAWTLSRIVAAVPLDGWTKQFNRSPAEWLDLVKKSDWRAALLEGWSLAACRQRREDWIETLLAAKGIHVSPAVLISHLSRPAREKWIAESIRAAGGKLRGPHLPILPLLLELDPPWSAELCRLVLADIRRQIPDEKARYDWELRHALKDFAAFVPPDLFEEAALGWPVTSEEWGVFEDEGNDFLRILQVRDEIHKEFSK